VVRRKGWVMTVSFGMSSVWSSVIGQQATPSRRIRFLEVDLA